MRERMTSYIPLTALTNEACARASSVWHKNSLFVKGDDVKVRGGLNDRFERWMSVADFLQASERFLDLIRRYYPEADRSAELVQGYAAHFAHVRTRTSLFSQPGLAMEYDMKARLTYQGENMIPGDFESDLWSQILADYSRLFNKREFDSEGYPLPHPPGFHSFASSSGVGSSSASGSGASAAPRSSAAPSPHRSWPRSDPAPRPTASSSAVAPAASVSRCFLCGSNQHAAKSCNGQAPWLRRGPDSSHGTPVYTSPSNSPVCFSYNARGCNRPSCNFAHVCTLCGHTSHTAQTCSSA